MQEEEKGIMYG
ncbi:Protein of unknown function [Bacillus cereus]|nr:Protein of unknown function [Bacillus cereus]SCL91399.1 Protein of unknown function [Bacillus wiedmannii]